MIGSIVFATLLASAAPPARIAVMIDDAAPGEPTRAALESALQSRGFEVVARELALDIRKVITPKDVLEGRLPANLSVLEADAILAGSAAYGDPTDVDGIKSLQIVVTVRLLDLATARTTATLTGNGVGLGMPGPNLAQRGAQKAVEAVFGNKALADGLADLGQQAGTVILIVQGLPTRAALGELRAELERTLAGAPTREIYFAHGIGKLALGGSKAKSLNGPEVADLLSSNKALPLVVTEVANTRIVATFERARTVSVHALVTEPVVPARMKAAKAELGRFVAGEMAKFGYVRTSYQASPLTRAAAVKRAAGIGAQVVVESEILGSGKESAFVIRIIDVKTGQPIVREQAVLASDASRFSTAEALLATIKGRLPEHLAATVPAATSPAVAEGTK